MDKRKVLVTGVGANVGQGIIRNIRSLGYDIQVVGCNVVSFSAGNHLCDAFYKVPFAYEADYIEAIKNIVENEHVDLIIPSTDYEAFYLSQSADKIDAVIAASDSETTGIYLDKYLSSVHHVKYNIPFAASFLPSLYKGEFDNFIAKPRKGRGSRGLHINPLTWNQFTDEEYVIQEFHKGEEVTTAFYVDKQNQLHGHITLLRDLDNGATTKCKVVFDYDKEIESILQGIIKSCGIRGSANLQSIVNQSGDIIPFEINCRISGTNSIRSNFGFEDVKYTVEEYLLNKRPSKPEIIPGIAVRILMDVIYLNKENYDECPDNKSTFYIY
jgi:carbamoyl-phosphate synthase large subunit